MHTVQNNTKTSNNRRLESAFDVPGQSRSQALSLCDVIRLCKKICGGCQMCIPRSINPSTTSPIKSRLKSVLGSVLPIDCSQSPYFSVGFSRLIRFDGAATILGSGSGGGEAASQLRSPPLGSLDTLPRSRSPLQTKTAAAPSKRTTLENPTEK